MGQEGHFSSPTSWEDCASERSPRFSMKPSLNVRMCLTKDLQNHGKTQKMASQHQSPLYCETQPSTVQRLSSSVFTCCCSFVRTHPNWKFLNFMTFYTVQTIHFLKAHGIHYPLTRWPPTDQPPITRQGPRLTSNIKWVGEPDYPSPTQTHHTHPARDVQ